MVHVPIYYVAVKKYAEQKINLRNNFINNINVH